MTQSDFMFTRDVVDKMSEQELTELINELLNNYGDDSLIADLIEESFLLNDVMGASRKKRQRKSIQKVIGLDYEDIFNKEDNKLLKTIRSIQLLLLTEAFEPQKEREPILVPAKNGKRARYVLKPDFADEHIIHHAIIRVLMPQLTKGMYKYSCACIPNRGVHYARKHIFKAITNDPKNTKYVLKMDIRHFFDSIPHRELKKRMRYLIKDPLIQRLMFKIIDTTDKGLPLGFYTSQWMANYYMQPMDHYIKERILDDCPGINTARTKRHGAVHYFRYMDDICIFGPNKKELHAMKKRIEEVLNHEYGLHLKHDWQVFRFDYTDKNGTQKGRFLDFIGFKFYRDKVTLRRGTYKRILRLIKRIVARGKDNIDFHDAASMLSYYGMIYWSDTKKLYTELLHPYVTLKDLKRCITKELRRRLHKLEESRK